VGFEPGNLVCTAWKIGKVKQKAISFSNPKKVKEMDGKTRIYLDLSSIKMSANAQSQQEDTNEVC
jgi:hypothetical protein